MTARTATRTKPREGPAFMVGAALLVSWALLGLATPVWAESERGSLVTRAIYYRSERIEGESGAGKGSRSAANIILGTGPARFSRGSFPGARSTGFGI